MGLASQLPAKNGFGTYKSPNIEKRYPNIVFSQFTGAEMMAEKYGLSKDELDEYSYESHQRAIAATQAGKFKDEIIPLQITRADGSTDIHQHRRRHPFRRQPRRHQGRQADRGERQAHRRQRQPDLRRRLRRDGGQRKGPEVARRQADGADPSHDHDGRRSRDHAGGAAARDRARAEEGRHVDRRHRPVRGQRGLRLGADRVAEDHRRRSRPGSTSMAAPSRSAIRSAAPAPS